MKSLIKAEIYKLHRRKVFYFILLFNCFSILFALGMYFNWGFIEVEGDMTTFNLIVYITSIWQLLFVTVLPSVFFMYLVANSIGTERIEGQILLEVTRVANRRKIIVSKFMGVLIVVMFYFITNVITSAFSYIFIVSRAIHADYSSNLTITSSEHVRLLTNSLGIILYLVFLIAIVMFISVKKSLLTAILSGFILHIILSFAVNIPNLGYFIPGHLALSSIIDNDSYSLIIVYQIVISLVICFLALVLAIRQFKKIDL